MTFANLSVCAKCPKGSYEPSETNGHGRVKVRPVVTCDLVGERLVGGSEMPEGGPYALEHVLTMDEAWDQAEEMENRE